MSKNLAFHTPSPCVGYGPVLLASCVVTVEYYPYCFEEKFLRHSKIEM